MPLPVGTWKINVNGAHGELKITEAAGVVNGSLSTDSGGTSEMIYGSWNETAQSLSFVSFSGGITLQQFTSYFTGYLFTTPRQAQPGEDLTWTLCGIVSSVPGANTAALGGVHHLRNSFGWYATKNQVL